MIHNLKIIFKRYLKLMGKKSLILIISWLLIYICSQSLLVIVPNHLFNILQTNGTILELFLCVLFLVITNIFNSMLREKNSKYFFLYRLKELGVINKFILNLPVSFVESSHGQNKIKEAQRAVSQGNEIGIEAFLSSFIYFVGAVSSVILFVILSAKLPIWLLLVIFLTPLIKIPLDIKRINIEKKDIKNMETVWNEDDRLKRICLNEKFGKESRLNNMISILEEKINNIVIKTKKYNVRNVKRKNKVKLYYFFIMLLRNIVILLAFIYSDKLNIQKNNFILYLNIILNLGRLLDDCYNNFNNIKSNNIYVNDFINIFNLKKYYKIRTTHTMPKPPYTIKFKNVSFSYENNNNNIILDNINFTIKSNEKIAIVGRNGSGKTTLVKLLCGLYYPTKGNITINDIDIKEIDKKSLYDELSISFQNPMILAMNVAENIGCVDTKNLNENKLDKVIHESGVDEIINNLPKKELTNLTHWLEDDGIMFSGGQIQKVMLARMLYKKSNILILDEPTASLDAIAEGELYEKYNTFSQNKLSIFISHRLSSTKFCDYIFVIDNGKIVQIGTHTELYQQEGLYKKMYLEQINNFKVENYKHNEEEVVYGE